LTCHLLKHKKWLSGEALSYDDTGPQKPATTVSDRKPAAAVSNKKAPCKSAAALSNKKIPRKSAAASNGDDSDEESDEEVTKKKKTTTKSRQHATDKGCRCSSGGDTTRGEGGKPPRATKDTQSRKRKADSTELKTERRRS